MPTIFAILGGQRRLWLLFEEIEGMQTRIHEVQQNCGVSISILLDFRNSWQIIAHVPTNNNNNQIFGIDSRVILC